MEQLLSFIRLATAEGIYLDSPVPNEWSQGGGQPGRGSIIETVPADSLCNQKRLIHAQVAGPVTVGRKTSVARYKTRVAKKPEMPPEAYPETGPRMFHQREKSKEFPDRRSGLHPAGAMTNR
jgi:hypothetical protein